MKNMSLVYVFTGDGKGKTSAALGVAVRAICNNMKVAWISWYKDDNWNISEKKLSQFMPIDFYLMGQGFYIKKLTKNKGKTVSLKNGIKIDDNKSKNLHKNYANLAYEKAMSIIRSQKYDLLILDEINNAISDNLLLVEKVQFLIEHRNSTHLILTGRNINSKILKIADLVSDIKKVKHPYDQGKLAVKGLDF